MQTSYKLDVLEQLSLIISIINFVIIILFNDFLLAFRFLYVLLIAWSIVWAIPLWEWFYFAVGGGRPVKEKNEYENN